MAYQLSQKAGVLPSQFYRIPEEYTAFCFDEAVIAFGMGVEAELNAVEGKNDKEIVRKKNQVLGKLLQLPDKQRFKSFGPKR